MFDAEATADDVLRGQRLDDRRVLITGASAGVGLETARALVGHGAQVVGAVRDPDAARRLFGEPSGPGSIRFVRLDLSLIDSVLACAEELLDTEAPFDTIICNAGVMAVPEGKTADGFERHFGINYIGHFVLVRRLAMHLATPARIVLLSSAGHRGADVSLNDPGFARGDYDPLVAYRRSKTALVLFAVELDRRLRASGVRATAVHPGAVLTETARALLDAQPSAATRFAWKTPAQGAATSVWAAFVAEAGEIGGRYCENCRVAEVDNDPQSGTGVRSYALDPVHAGDLWELTERLIERR